MIQKPPVIKLRNLKDLQCSQKIRAEVTTPTKSKKPRRKAATTATKTKKVTLDLKKENDEPTSPAPAPVAAVPAVASSVKPSGKSARKRSPPPSQLRINTFFKTCEKTYKIEPVKEEATPFLGKSATGNRKTTISSTTKKSTTNPIRIPKQMGGRKRLFVDDDDDIKSIASSMKRNVVKCTATTAINNNECINLLSDSEEEDEVEKKQRDAKTIKAEKQSPVPCNGFKTPKMLTSVEGSDEVGAISPHSSATPLKLDSGTSKPVSFSVSKTKTSSTRKAKTPGTTSKRKPKPCPPYKIIEGTSFAVDAFQYGDIDGVSEYFLTHFHADHYIGLTKKFNKPLFMSSVTARFVRTFIHVDEPYIHELELSTPAVVNGIEVTALDANHCPGAVMLLFKFKTGKCILHTGDFRAWHGMEEEPSFWNNDISTLYLDTTYLSHKYAFCTQYESIDRAKNLVQAFRDKHADKNILYICGSYVIGKEKFWSSLAEEFELKVWTEDNRYKALKAMQDEHLDKLLVESPLKADMHVIAMGKVSYLSLVDYFSMYQHRYDLVLAIRPSGWEKDSRPQYRGKINIIGVEYSEHSSYEEMKRFVKFLKPEKVISTVPVGRDLMVTPNVPEKWYKYDKLNTSTNYQPRIDQFLGKTPLRKAMIRMSNTNKEGLEAFVSPLSKKQHKNTSQEINNNDTNDVDVITVPSISTSANEFDPPLILNQKQKIKNDKNNTENTIDVGVSSSQTKIKSEKLSPKIKTSPKKEVSDNSTMDVILSQGLKDGEMCSIFITNTSSDYFEKSTSTSKSRCRRRIITSGSEDGRELPVSQKRKNVIKAKRKPFKPSMPPTKEEDGEKFACQKDENTKVVKENTFPNPEYDLDKPMTSKKAAELMLSLKKKNPLKSTSNSRRTASLSYSANEEIASSQTSAYNRDVTMTSKEPSELMLSGQKNPLLKSSSNSRASSLSYSANEEIAASQTSDGRCRSIRSLRNKKQSSSNDTIPASQTTLDLANTPRPLRNKISQYIVIKSASQTSKDLEETPRAVRNKLLSCKNSQNDDIIPASQTTADLACTPRPIRNKRLHSTPMSALTTSPPKKPSSPNESLSQPTKLTSPSGRSSAQLNINNDDEDVVACPVEEHSFTQSQLLTQIMKENQNVDIYNTSKLIDIVKDALADQKADASTDHIPLELLSDPDAEDDWID